MMTSKTSWVLGAVVLGLTGCASMIDGLSQRVEFITPGVVGADCRAESENYKYHIYTPDVVTLERSYYPLTITCKADGYETEIVEIAPHANETAGFNVVNGIIPGYLYDAGSRAVMEYPDTIEIYMTPKPVETETVVPLYQEPVVEVIPPPVAYQTDVKVQEVITGVK